MIMAMSRGLDAVIVDPLDQRMNLGGAPGAGGRPA
jgi:hypothetical protein